VVDDDFSKAESLNNYFSSVFTKEDDSPPSPCLPKYEAVVISIEGVTSLLEGLDSSAVQVIFLPDL